jgi:enoyl-CoA hydratase
MIEMMPQVSYAAINGHALGGGCELALACDFRIMAKAARIGLPESNLGLIPGWGGTQRLPELIGPAKARQLLFSGEQITAERALQIGLVDEVVAGPDDLEPALQRWNEAICKGAPNAIVRIKRALFSGDEIHQFGCCFSCDDAREGMKAFLQKRAPNWTNE